MTEAMITGAGIALVSFLSGYLAHYLITLLRVARAQVAVRRADLAKEHPMRRRTTRDVGNSPGMQPTDTPTPPN